MWLHLEIDACGGVYAEDIRQAILECRGRWRQYGEDVPPIVCPTCERVYWRVSAFLQHIESNSCAEGYHSGFGVVYPMLRQLTQKLRWRRFLLYGKVI